MPSKHKSMALAGLVASALLVLVAVTNAHAADTAGVKVGGDCCSDLEERIAELEAVTAKKGNRKVTLTVSGQINKSLTYLSLDGQHDTYVGENSAAESYVRFNGEAHISPNLKAGFVLEIGVGGFSDGLSINSDTNGIYTRRSFVYIDSANVGKLSIGHASQATDDITSLSTANTNVAVRMLSLRPLVGPQVGEVLDVFDGGRADIIRYDSPALQGFIVSASWGNADLTGNGQTYDVAVRYNGEFKQFKVVAGVGYRQGVVVPTFGATEDVKVWAGSASVKHLPTGIFVTGAAGQLEGQGPLSFIPNLKGWQVQSGVEEKWLALGHTTVFGEFGELTIDGSSSTPRLMGLGLVQAVDQAALDVYVNWRRYELDFGSNPNIDVVTAGARIRF